MFPPQGVIGSLPRNRSETCQSGFALARRAQYPAGDLLPEQVVTAVRQLMAGLVQDHFQIGRRPIIEDRRRWLGIYNR